MNIITINHDNIKDSLIPNWKINNINHKKESEKIIYIKETIKNKYFQDYILTSYKSSNILNNLEADNLDENIINKIEYLHNLGMIFEFKDDIKRKIEINSFDIIFPICCVGKNRSQYLFYYLKNKQSDNPNIFQVGYPMSGDELATIIKNNNNSVLSGFSVQYKSDSLSKAIKLLYHTELSRSIHVFDKLLKIEEEYTENELKNLENHKYKKNKYDIFDENINKEIKKLFINYYLNPLNIRNILKKEARITYICLSSESYKNLINIFYELSINNKLDLHNTRIIYYGIKDIFQGSKLNEKLLNELQQKIELSFIFE